MEKCSYRDFGKKGGHYWYINDKTSWPTPISQHKDVYTANAHTIWCEQADNLSWSKLRNRFLALFGSLQENCHSSIIAICGCKDTLILCNTQIFMDNFFYGLILFFLISRFVNIDY